MNSSFHSKSFASPFFTPIQSNSLNLNDSFIQTNRHFNTPDLRLQSGNAARNLNSILHCRTMIDSESSRQSTPRIYEGN